MRSLKNSAKAAAIGLAILAIPSASKAQTIFADFFSDACNSGLGCVSPPTTLLATAALTQNGADVNVSITIGPTPGFSFFQAGNPPIVMFMAAASNTADATIGGTSAAMTGLNGGTADWKYDPTGSGYSPPYSAGGADNFAHGVGYEPKANIAFTFPIVFTLEDVVLADFVLGTKSNGDPSPYIMALDMINSCATHNTAGACVSGTGFVGGLFRIPGRQGGEVPLPAALPLFVSGLGALGLLGWRRKRKNAAAV